MHRCILASSLTGLIVLPTLLSAGDLVSAAIWKKEKARFGSSRTDMGPHATSLSWRGAGVQVKD